ncbi:MAG: YHYH protein [Bacteroidota bacterium]|nr:YHYH protein [Bacteroidota bacterium]MDP4231122.1 YHYH protein [Bacteroidota bacterium]
MKYFFFVLIILFSISEAQAQLDPVITSWIINTTGKTGYGGSVSNVEQVQYSADNVYVSASCIPGYDIGPWPGNPNTPRNQNFVFKITRHPQANSGTAIGTPLGHIGIWSNGVSIFNAKDAMSYQGAGVWNQNAIIVEGASFDNCLGHPSPTGEYHHHLNPRCLYDDTDSLHHSPIIGFAFDGFPIYGAYGFSKTDGSGSITRMRSSYRMRTISDRTTLPDGTALNSSQYGPPLSEKPLGYYIEDFEFIKGSGDLDEHNGRFCVTPEYPGGTYAYFVTLDSTGTAAYPYTLGLTYYGVVQPGNTGPKSGNNKISESVITYGASGVTDATSSHLAYSIFPNPATSAAAIFIDPSFHNNVKLIVIDCNGKTVYSQDDLQPAVTYSLDIHSLANGTYVMSLTDSKETATKRLVISR